MSKKKTYYTTRCKKCGGFLVRDGWDSVLVNHVYYDTRLKCVKCGASFDIKDLKNERKG
jgi:DNA-directed RNA polymerase subunit RPC12/RpoP